MTDASKPRRARRIAPELALVLLALLLYARTAAYPFLFDDTAIVAGNRLVESLSNLPEIFRSSYWEGTVLGGAGGLYRPLTIAMYAVEHAIYGENPAGYHVVNILLHALVTVLVYRLFAELAERRTAWIGAALFAVHPVHVEAIAGVVGRAELLSAALVLGALLLHRAWRPPGRAAGARSLGARTPWVCGAFYLAAALTKESALTAIALVASYEFAFRYEGRFGAWARALPHDAVTVYLPWIAAAALALGMRAGVLGALAEADPRNAVDNPLIVAPTGARIPTALRIFAEYVRLAVFPLRLSSDYSANQVPVSSWGDGAVWIGATLAVAAAGGLALAGKRRGVVLFAALWCAVTYAVIANVFVLIGTVVAERLLYLPSAAFCMLVAAALAARPIRARRAFAVAVPALAIALLGTRAWVRVADWRSENSVIVRDVESAPNSARLRSQHGQVFMEQWKIDEAVAEFDRAIEIAPNFSEPYLFKGLAATGAGDYEGAALLYLRAVQLTPRLLTVYERSARERVGFDIGHSIQMLDEGNAALERADRETAVEAFEAALMLAPNPEAARRLAETLLDANQPARALEWIARAILWEPASAEAHAIASRAHAALGDAARSQAEAEAARRLGGGR